jgi:hypothetical protein
MVLNPEGTVGRLLESLILAVVLIPLTQRRAGEISADSGTTGVNLVYRRFLSWTSIRMIDLKCNHALIRRSIRQMK